LQAWLVEVPGGACTVATRDGELTLTGPAELVAEIELDPSWVYQHR
jgi:hypothetical protein